MLDLFAYESNTVNRSSSNHSPNNFKQFGLIKLFAKLFA